jgi:hypothetical protein
MRENIIVRSLSSVRAKLMWSFVQQVRQLWALAFALSDVHDVVYPDIFFYFGHFFSKKITSIL